MSNITILSIKYLLHVGKYTHYLTAIKVQYNTCETYEQRNMNYNLKTASLFLLMVTGPSGPIGHWGVVAQILDDEKKKEKVYKFDGVYDKENRIFSKWKEFENLAVVEDGLRPGQKMTMIKNQVPG